MNNISRSKRESSLHFAIKNCYSIEGDKLEEWVDGFIVDIVRGDLLIKIQTSNFSMIKTKLSNLLNGHKVRLVYPIPKIKWIVYKSMCSGKIYRKRKSPKKGNLYDLFNELIKILNLLSHKNLSIEVLMVEMEEIRCNDGKGSWRRKGISIKDRKLVRIFEKIVFENKSDFLKVLPENLSDPFTNRNLAKVLKISVNQSRKITYVLRKIGVLAYVGKNGNQMLFKRLHNL
ncbi:MAG: hypothetical protein QXS74_02500 [Nitrososphaeria archaeon]